MRRLCLRVLDSEVWTRTQRPREDIKESKLDIVISKGLDMRVDEETLTNAVVTTMITAATTRRKAGGVVILRTRG
jgi:hypothetical protein